MQFSKYVSLPFVMGLLWLALAGAARAQAPMDAGATAGPTNLMVQLGWLVMLAVIFTLIGVVLFTICIFIVVKVLPFSVRQEIEEDQNVALGIIIASMILGIAIILAAAIMG